MSEFKFVCRQIELNEALSSLTNSELVLLHSQNNSGLTHFLKKLMQSLWDDSSVSFYIDGESFPRKAHFRNPLIYKGFI